MSRLERPLYRSVAAYWLNQTLLPLKLVVPQPVWRHVPGLTSNLEIRTGIVLGAVRGRLIDIGCGGNLLVRRYRDSGGEGLGVDVYPWPGADLVVEDTARLPQPDSSFDTATLVACFNHIPNREAVLAELFRLLAPGGRLVLTNLSPTVSRLWHAWAFWDEDQHERGMKDGEVWGFTRDQLIALVEQAGFRLEEEAGFSWGLNQFYRFSRP